MLSPWSIDKVFWIAIVCIALPLSDGFLGSTEKRVGRGGSPRFFGQEDRATIGTVSTTDATMPDKSTTSGRKMISTKKKKRRLKGSSKEEPPSDTVTKKKSTRKQGQSKEKVEAHWLVDSDEFVIVNAVDSRPCKDQNMPVNATAPSLVKLTVRGNPLPLRRHRTSRGFVYNPSATAQESFRQAVQRLIHGAAPFYQEPTESSPLFWDSSVALAATIVFRMKRPKAHFVNNLPGAGRLRATAPKATCSALRTDVDNLAKFVLDSLNGVLYEDDRQITSLHVIKLYDNDTDQLCQGSTCICLRALTDDDIPQLLENSFNLFPLKKG